MSTEWIKPMEWEAEGIEPSEALKQSGFSTGYKPPADLMNYFLHKSQESIEQLQDEMDNANERIDTANKATETLKKELKDADTELSDKIDDASKTLFKKVEKVANATSTDGVAYTATLEGVDELYAGLVITIVPLAVSTNAAITLNVNNLGAKSVRVRTGNTTATLETPKTASWLSSGQPVRMTYNGALWVADLQKQSMENVTDVLPIENGGTGSSDVAGALKKFNLDKVNNTTDAEKHVAFASEAGTARKTANALIVRFKGGDTEGTDKWTFDGSTSRSVNITPAKIGASAEGHTHSVKDVKDTVAAISTDGVAYTATVEGITELYNGLTITIIPNMLSASKNTTLNVNNLGAKQLRCSIGGYNYGNSGTIAALDGWLGADSPVTIQYKAKFDNWQTIIPRPSVTGLYGTVKVEQGGTGADNADEARENLGLGSVATENIVPITKGGTGATDVANARTNLGITPTNIGAVPTTRKVNNKALSADISLTHSDVGAAAASHTHTASDVGAVPTTRKVNGKALSSDISLTYTDVNAAYANHNHDLSTLSGTLPVESGGTGVNNIDDFRATLDTAKRTRHHIASWYLSESEVSSDAKSFLIAAREAKNILVFGKTVLLQFTIIFYVSNDTIVTTETIPVLFENFEFDSGKSLLKSGSITQTANFGNGTIYGSFSYDCNSDGVPTSGINVTIRGIEQFNAGSFVNISAIVG